MPQTTRTSLAGVPAVVRHPPRVETPPLSALRIVVLWHGFGPPGSEIEMAEALPLDGVPALKVYLGLPLFSSRVPPGGVNELQQRQAQDYVEELFLPAVAGAATELWAALEALWGSDEYSSALEVALVGFSAGGLAPMLALTEFRSGIGGSGLITAAAVINSVPRLRDLVELSERLSGNAYNWSDRSRIVSERFDFVARAGELAAPLPDGRLPWLLLLHGSEDEYFDVALMEELNAALSQPYAGSPERLSHLLVAGLSHHFGFPNSSLPVRISNPAAVERGLEEWLVRWCAS